jgi:hypothetical protein
MNWLIFAIVIDGNVNIWPVLPEGDEAEVKLPWYKRLWQHIKDFFEWVKE